METSPKSLKGATQSSETLRHIVNKQQVMKTLYKNVYMEVKVTSPALENMHNKPL